MVDGHDPGDVLLGAAAVAVSAVRLAATPLVGLARVGRALVPRSVPLLLAERGAAARPQAERLLRVVLGRVVDVLVGAIDLTAVAARAIDLDALAAQLDVDAVVARADLDAAVRRVDIASILDRVDLDAVVARVDIAAVVDRVDIAAVLDRVDLDAVVDRVDLDAIAAGIDIGAILARVDVDAVIARVDIDRMLERLDLAGISLQVVDAIDLPEILRQSTGTVATEAVRGVRAESAGADEAVTRFVDRLLRRAGHPGEPGPGTTPGPALP